VSRRLVAAGSATMGPWRSALASAVVLSVSGWPILTVAKVAQAAQPSAVCHIDVHNTQDPGLRATRSDEGTGTSRAGTIVCVGAVDGQQLSAEPGTFAWRWRYGGEESDPLRGSSCITGRTTGSWDVTLALADGTPLALTGPMTGQWTGTIFTVRGQLGRHAAEGIGQVRFDSDHLDEDCVTKPVRHYSDTIQVAVS